MNAQLATLPQLAGEMLTASQWAVILDIDSRSFRRRVTDASSQQIVAGNLTNVFAFEDLPADWRSRGELCRERHVASSYAELLEMLSVERRWKSPRPWMDFPASARERALKRRVALDVYFRLLENDVAKGVAEKEAANEWERLFNERCTPRTIRNWVGTINQRGGHEFAPDVAYCDGKSCDHPRQRVTNKRRIPEELLTEFADRTAHMEHMQSAYNSLVLDWKMGREVKGLGYREGNADFPYKFAWMRPHAPGTATRRLGSHGSARAKRECLPFVHTTTATLRRCELLLLDDTRIDIIAARDRDGFPVELKAYVLMDVASRQILGFIVKEEEALRAEDVWALLANVLSVAGLPVGYPMHIKFERGAVACSSAAQTLLESLWPGRIKVHRTGMDGGRAHKAAFFEAGSGHWMGKSHIESFMRTLAFRLEHIAGQRGGDYKRQPAQLGLLGKDREAGRLEYTRGSLIHQGAQTEMCDRILKWIETGDFSPSRTGGNEDRQLKIDARNGRHLLPVRWVRDAIQEAIAFYNNTQNHRMEGFARIEYQDQETGALKWRMESPDERAAALEFRNPTEAIRGADAAALLQYRGRAVTVTKSGVTFDCAPWRGLNFFNPDSRIIHEVSRLATQQRQYVALVDEETLRNWHPEAEWKPQIHLIGEIGNPDAWQAGQPGRYLESLPLAAYADRTDPGALAAAKAKAETVFTRAKGELLYASRNVIAEELARTKENTTKVEGAISMLRTSRQQAAPSALVDSINQSGSDDLTRREQRDSTAPDYASTLPIHQETEY